MTNSLLLGCLILLSALPVAVEALSSSTTTASTSKGSILSNTNSVVVTPDHMTTISRGGVAIIPNFLSSDLVDRMRADAKTLFRDGYFVPDGLTNTALQKSQQGFSQKADRQTFRGGEGWSDPKAGDRETREEFASLMAKLRHELAVQLDRPTLSAEGSRKHEMTYNYYEPGASLGRHLDEHHEETKGNKGWLLPTRRSVTWLVYLNDDWRPEEGGSLHTFPRPTLATDSAVGAHEGDLQVGWIDGVQPVFLDVWRESGQTALYTAVVDDSNNNNKQLSKRIYISAVDFDVPRQPIEFERFLSPPYRKGGRFEQISTARLDPRFVVDTNTKDPNNDGNNVVATSPATKQQHQQQQEAHHLDIFPIGGTLVLFDSVSLPHSVNAVTGKRQRIAATGWFHEDNQALPMS